MNIIKRILIYTLAIVMSIAILSVQVFATTVTVLDGQISITDTANSNTLSGSTVTITAKGSIISKKTNTITITNETDSKATISFDYSVSKYNSFTIAGTSESAAGTYTTTLESGATITVVLISNSGLSNTTATLTLSNFSCTTVSDNATATVTYDSAKGSVSLGGSVVASGGSATATGGQLAAVATPVSGCSFLGWVNTDTHEILSTATTTTLNVPQSMNVQAVFVNSTSDTAWFTVDSKYMTNNLTTAGSLGAKIVLANNGTLSGTHTIPKEVNLLIPYSASDSGDFCAEPTGINVESSPSTPTGAFRTLTLSSGAVIDCYGAINVNGQRSIQSQPYPGVPTGQHGKLVLTAQSTTAEDTGKSQLILRDGSSLYCYGFITGSGRVEAQSGSTVHELLQLCDWRGGTGASKWQDLGDSVTSFIINFYYAQNIEAPFLIASGANIYAESAMYISASFLSSSIISSIPYINNTDTSVFKLSSGNLLRTYHASDNQITYNLQSGTMSVGSLDLTIEVNKMKQEVSSAGKILALPTCTNIVVGSGATLNVGTGIKLLPGSSLDIQGTCNLSSDLYLYDWQDYEKKYHGMYENNTDSNGTDANQINLLKSAYYSATLGITPSLPNRTTVGSAKLNVDGVLNITGALYTTTNGATNIDKVVTGTGTIVNNGDYTDADGNLVEMVMHYSNNTYVATTVTCSPVVGQLAGITESNNSPAYNSFGKATYYGLGADLNNYWYQHTVTLAEGTTQTITPTTDSVWDGSTGYIVTGGAFKFTVDGSTEKECISATNATVSYADGVYIVTGDDDGGNVVISIGHIPGAAATCTTNQVCTREGCGVELAAALGHDFTEQNESVCTLVSAGDCQNYKTYYADCSRCDQDGTEIWTSTTYGNHVQATSYSSDGTNHWYECTVCSADLHKAECSGGTATCTAQATCTVCGNKHGETLAHDYDTSTYLKDETGHWHKCKNCSATTEVVAHTYTSEVTSPTCTAAGYTTYTCACGYSYTGNTVAAAGHTYVNHDAKAPGCETIGWDAYQTCENCSYTTYAEKPATGHTEVVDKAVAATCTTTGLTEGKHCSVCSAVLVEQTTTDALGHTEVVDAAIAATCTATGLTEGKHCSVCNEVLVAQNEVAALGHTNVVDTAVAPTCGETGLTEGSHCSVCGEVTKAQEVVAASGHTEVIDAAVDADCTNTGLTEGKHCGVCGEVILAQQIVPSLVHDEVVDNGYPETCTADGLTDGKHCSRCGEVLVQQEAIPAGHDWDSATGKCSSCGEACAHKFDSDSDTVCDICGFGCEHSMAVVVTNPTCTDGGYTTHTCEKNCGYTYVTDEKAALGHSWVDADCITPKTCSVCKAIEGEALGHTSGETVQEVKTAANCTESGLYENVIYCSVCNTELSRIDGAVIPATGHSYKNVVTAPTCTEKGYTTHTCTNTGCNYSYVDSYTDALSHNWTEWQTTQESTCTAAGSKSRSCQNEGCQATETQPIAALNHDLPEEWTVITEATCTESGEQQRKCSRCDYIEKKSIDKIAHSYAEVVTPPTCTEAGYTTYTCSCGATYTGAEVAKLGHTSGEAKVENETPATCGNAGSYDSVVYCTICTAELTRTPTAIPATGEHNYDSGVVTTEPTCTEAGVLTKTCTACGATTTEIIAALGHDEVSHEAQAPTCIDIGWDAYVTCSRCDYTTKVDIPVIDHSDSETDQDHICDTEGCGEVMNACSDAENDGNHTCDICGAENISAHSWNDATCTAPKTCSECGATEGTSNDHSYTTSTVAPTCTTSGYTTYTCSGCGDTYTDDETEATGHGNTTTTTVDATCVDAGSVMVTCDDCGTTISTETIAATGHNYVDGVCTGCGEAEPVELFKFYGTNITLGNSLDMKFAFPISGSSDWTGYYVEMVRTFSNGSENKITRVPYGEDWEISGSYYVIVYGGFAAKEMCDTVTLTVYNAQGIAVSEPWSDSMRSYVMRNFDKSTNDLQKRAMVDMLIYGAAAQKKFDYGTDDLATRYLEERHLVYATDSLKAVTNGQVKPAEFYNSNITIQSNIIFKMAFTGITDDMYAVATFTGHKNNEVSVRVQGSEFVSSGSYKILALENMVVADARCMVTVIVYNADGTVYTTCQDSIESYVARNLGKAEVFEAFMKFADSAHAYLHRND